MSDCEVRNKTDRCRPPPSCFFINSTPSDNKSPTWSNRFLHKLTVVAHPARLQQLHFQPVFYFSLILVSTNNPFGDSFSCRTNADPQPFVSNSDRHFAVFVVQLHLCSSIPEFRSRAATDKRPGQQARWHQAVQEVFPFCFVFWPRTGKAWKTAVTIVPNDRNVVDILKTNSRKIIDIIFKWI